MASGRKQHCRQQHQHHLQQKPQPQQQQLAITDSRNKIAGGGKVGDDCPSVVGQDDRDVTMLRVWGSCNSCGGGDDAGVGLPQQRSSS